MLCEGQLCLNGTQNFVKYAILAVEFLLARKTASLDCFSRSFFCRRQYKLHTMRGCKNIGFKCNAYRGKVHANTANSAISTAVNDRESAAGSCLCSHFGWRVLHIAGLFARQ